MNPGKLVRLRALADHDGRLQLVDLRSAGDLTPQAAELLSSQAGGLLLDPRVGLPMAAAVLDRGCQLVLALGTDWLIDGWSLSCAARAGAVAVHLAVTTVEAAERVAMIADEAAKLGLPLLLQLELPPEECASAVAQMLSDDTEVDLLVLPWGAPPPPDGWPRPWLLAGPETGYEVWLVALRDEPAACGFVTGASLLAGIPDDAVGAELWLAEEALWRLRRAVVDGERGAAWADHPWFAELVFNEVDPQWWLS